MRLAICHYTDLTLPHLLIDLLINIPTDLAAWHDNWEVVCLPDKAVQCWIHSGNMKRSHNNCVITALQQGTENYK